jgi:capsular exopolysaccharide synthesis family protein
MTAASLAVTMAANGSRVLLVDTDMRRPRLHKVFGVGSETGLSSLMLGQGSLATEARRTGIENLSLLPCGPVPPNPAELLHSEAFPRLLRELSAAFDRVIIDSPPVGVVADAAVVGAAVDGALLVLKAGKTTREAARQAVRQLRDVNTRIVGAVLNEVDLAHATYGVEYYGYGEYSSEPRSGRRGEPPAA